MKIYILECRKYKLLNDKIVSKPRLRKKNLTQ
jgi:hypothetical protein